MVYIVKYLIKHGININKKKYYFKLILFGSCYIIGQKCVYELDIK